MRWKALCLASWACVCNRNDLLCLFNHVSNVSETIDHEVIERPLVQNPHFTYANSNRMADDRHISCGMNYSGRMLDEHVDEHVRWNLLQWCRHSRHCHYGWSGGRGSYLLIHQQSCFPSCRFECRPPFHPARPYFRQVSVRHTKDKELIWSKAGYFLTSINVKIGQMSEI